MFPARDAVSVARDTGQVTWPTSPGARPPLPSRRRLPRRQGRATRLALAGPVLLASPTRGSRARRADRVRRRRAGRRRPGVHVSWRPDRRPGGPPSRVLRRRGVLAGPHGRGGAGRPVPPVRRRGPVPRPRPYPLSRPRHSRILICSSCSWVTGLLRGAFCQRAARVAVAGTARRGGTCAGRSRSCMACWQAAPRSPTWTGATAPALPRWCWPWCSGSRQGHASARPRRATPRKHRWASPTGGPRPPRWPDRGWPDGQLSRGPGRPVPGLTRSRIAVRARVPGSHSVPGTRPRFVPGWTGAWEQRALPGPAVRHPVRPGPPQLPGPRQRGTTRALYPGPAYPGPGYPDQGVPGPGYQDRGYPESGWAGTGRACPGSVPRRRRPVRIPCPR